MTARRMLLYDIPDDHQLVPHYLDEIRTSHAEISGTIALEHLKDVANEGRISTGCTPMGEELWALDVAIGFGDVARFLFFETPRGDYMLVHGFTIKSGGDADRGFSVAVERKRGLS